MYIDPFWAGVFCAITVEVVALIIYALFTADKRK